MKEQCPLLKQEITAFFELVSEYVYIQCKWSWGLQRWTKHTCSQEAYNFLRKWDKNHGNCEKHNNTMEIEEKVRNRFMKKIAND